MEEKARRLVAEYVQKRKTDIEELRARHKGNPMKIKLAGALRGVTAMPTGWIAEELNSGTPGSWARSRIKGAGDAEICQ